MFIVSTEIRNIALLQPRAGSDDTTFNYFFHEFFFSIVLI